MPKHREVIKLPWTPENVKRFILECRADGGIPMFRTHYAGIPFEYAGQRAVVAICWGGYGRAPDSVLFFNVPEDIIKELEREKGDWKFLLLRYGTVEDLIKAMKYPVILTHYKESAELIEKIIKKKD